MPRFDETTWVSALVAERPSLSRILERHGIDYCCGGNQSLQSACEALGLTVQSVLADIVQAMAAPAEPNLLTLPLPEVVQHIVSLHHGFLREALPLVSSQLDRVVLVHGPSHPELAEVQAIFREFVSSMNQHMDKEEKVLFPLICNLGRLQGAESLERILDVMEAEHQDSGADLARMRTLLHDYKVPEGACGTYRAVLQGLVDIEEDTHLHVHSENHVLFPRALQEARLRFGALQEL